MGNKLSLIRFTVFIMVSLILFMGILRWSLRTRSVKPAARLVGSVALFVVVFGMCFAKFGATSGFPWPIYYGLPAAATLLLPPLVFRMRLSEFVWYLLLAFASSPAIHVVFSFFIGWHEYIPFWYIPQF